MLCTSLIAKRTYKLLGKKILENEHWRRERKICNGLIYEKHINKLYLYNFYILFKIIKGKYYIFFTYQATTL